MKILTRNKLHLTGQSHDVTIVSCNGATLKFTYTVNNEAEEYEVQVFKNYTWNFLANLFDLGIPPSKELYVTNAAKREARADYLFQKAIGFINLLLTNELRNQSVREGINKSGNNSKNTFENTSENISEDISENIQNICINT